MVKDDKSFGGALARYGKVSTTMAGLAARVAGERYLGLKIEREERLPPAERYQYHPSSAEKPDS